MSGNSSLSESSERKVTNSAADKQGDSAKSSGLLTGNKPAQEPRDKASKARGKRMLGRKERLEGAGIESGTGAVTGKGEAEGETKRMQGGVEMSDEMARKTAELRRLLGADDAARVSRELLGRTMSEVHFQGAADSSKPQ